MGDETTIQTQSGRSLRVDDLIHRGDNFEIVRATSTGDRGRQLSVRSLRIDESWPPTVRNDIAGLRAAEGEAASILFDSDAGIEAVEDSDSDANTAGTLVLHPYVEGTTLQRYVHAQFTDGMPVSIALNLARQVAQQLASLHDAKLVHRSPSPEHVVISGETATLVGFGNVCRRQQRPAPWQLGGDERYVAPEVIRERSGTFIHPRADVYTLGATLSYMLTGIHPTTTPEAPINNEAWRRLMETPEGVRLLIAHCMQPLHKNRLVNASKLIPLLDEDSLPDRKTTGFGAIALLAPWTGALEGKSSGLSAGPLTTRAAQASQVEEADEPDDEGLRETSNHEEAPSTNERSTIEVRGVRKSRLFIAFGMIALVAIGGAILRLCGA